MRPIIVYCAISLLAAGCFKVNTDLGFDDMGPPDPAAGDDMAPATELVESAELQAVTGDQSLLAYLGGVTSSNGVDVGTLTVTGLSSTTKVTVSADAWGAGFGGTATLLYLTGPTPSTDANSTSVYGTWALWKPGQSAGIHLSKGLAPVRTTPPTDAWTMYWDVSTPSVTTSGPIELTRIGDCTATECVPVTIAASATHVSTMSASPDGRFGAYVVNLGTSPATYDVFLVTEATGASMRVSASATGTSNSFSPDGNRFAAIGPGGALVVVDTATGQPSPWADLPAGAKTQQVSFANSTTLVVRAIPTGVTAGNAYVTTVAAATLLATGVATMELPRNSSSTSGTARYAFMTSTTTSGVGPVVGYDLSAVTPVPIPIATAASTASVAVSSDQTYVRVLDNFDSDEGTGTLVAVSLPDGTPSSIADDVTTGGPSFAGAHTLFYIDGTGTLGSWLDGAFTSYADSVDQHRVRGSGGTALYFSLDQTDDIYGYQPGVYVTAP